MLNHLWKRINRLNIKAAGKYRLFRFALELPAALAGLLLWWVLPFPALKVWDRMLCFMGYPVLLACLFAFLYCCNHDFTDISGKSL